MIESSATALNDADDVLNVNGRYRSSTVTASDNISKRRSAGLLEAYFIARGSLDLYRCVVVWAACIHAIPRVKIYDALNCVVLANPELRTVVLDSEEPAPQLGLLREIPINESVVEFRRTDDEQSVLDFQKLLPELHATKFYYDSGHPLWKVIVYNDRYVAFVYDHGILDGISGALFLTQFFEALCNDDKLISVPKNEFNPILDAMVEISPEVAERQLNQQKAGDRNAAIFAPYSVPVESDNWRVITLSKGKSDILLQRCRDHSVTLTALLHTVLLASVSKVYPETTGFDTMIPINARRYCRLPSTCDRSMDADAFMGSYIFQYKEIAPALINGKFSWAEALRFNKKIKDATSDREIQAWFLHSLKNQYGNMRASIMNMMGKPRMHDIVVSNLGAHRFPPTDAYFSVTSAGFSQPNCAIMAPIKANCISVHDGPLTIVVGFADDMVGVGKGHLVVDEIESIIDYITN
ncbi:alcohol acetyltransferase-domain-containing protein [Dipodascopsis uninucleata]